MSTASALRSAVLLSSVACGSGLDSGWAIIDGVGVLGVADAGEAYLCGQGEAVDQSRWLTGGKEALPSEDGLWSLSIDDDGSFELERGGDEVLGTLTPFEDGGLYAAEPEACRSGAVLYDEQLAGTFCDGLGSFVQVEPVDTLLGGPTTIRVTRADDATYAFDLRRLP